MSETIKIEGANNRAKDDLGNIAIEVVGKDALLVASSIRYLHEPAYLRIFGEGLSPSDTALWRKNTRLLEGIKQWQTRNTP